MKELKTERECVKKSNMVSVVLWAEGVGAVIGKLKGGRNIIRHFV